MKPENVKLFVTLFGEAGQKMADEAETTDPAAARLIEEMPLERIWARPGLPLRDKSMITLTSQIVLERWDQVELHMRSFLRVGGTPAELRELCYQLSVYCGFPVMVRALRQAHAIFAEAG